MGIVRRRTLAQHSPAVVEPFELRTDL